MASSTPLPVSESWIWNTSCPKPTVTAPIVGSRSPGALSWGAARLAVGAAVSGPESRVPSDPRLKLRSELVRLHWWTSTASTFVPSTRRSETTLKVVKVDSSAPPTVTLANVSKEMVPAGMFFRTISCPLR